MVVADEHEADEPVAQREVVFAEDVDREQQQAEMEELQRRSRSAMKNRITRGALRRRPVCRCCGRVPGLTSAAA